MPDLKCPDFREPLMEMARADRLDLAGRRDLMAHLAGCPACVRELEMQQALTAAFRDMKRGVVLPDESAMEATLLAEFDRVNRRRRPVVYRMALAAALLIGVVLAARLVVERRDRPPAPAVARIMPPAAPVPPVLTVRATPPSPSHRAKPRAQMARPAENADPQQFVAIPYTLPLAPYERAEVVRMDLPVAAMIAAGLPLNVADAGAHASADVLVGEDGRARAIRLISISSFDSQ